MSEARDHFIEGRLAAPSSGRYLDTYNPRTAGRAGSVAAGSAADVDKAVASSVAALAAWRERKPVERGRVLMKIAAGIRAHIETLSAIEAAETGKPSWQTPFEIEYAAQYFEFYGGLVNLFRGETIDIGPGYHSYTVHEPFGAIGVILPWNAPLNQAARGIAPALAAGNTVVAKPSEFTSGSLVALARICVEECDLPAGVVNVVLGAGDEAGAALVSHPGIRKVAFTGSVRAGQRIGHLAADKIMPLTLELGGKSPNIIFEDADLSKAIPGAVRAFVMNAGQICTAGTRCLVQRSVYEDVLQGLKAGAETLKLGPDPDAQMGPLTTQAQFEKVQRYFDIARSEGVRIVTGGDMPAEKTPGEGWFVPPTIYADVRNDMRIAREEIFGPVVSVIPFDDEAEAVRIANDTDYGLAAGLWTENLSRAHRVASCLQAGQIYVNEYQAGGVETPLGGYKKSGYGREKGIEALRNYTQLKCVTMKL
ncbi:MAG: aldehyde dehydrogenase [Alphaproteobacteria bacterium HGW-Alphaproteobacteria-5]|nr:MAG: aldehyde dehydrogenase [Alphaproteobacteria bacterium HGW-Alphaproteobacteria-5]